MQSTCWLYMDVFFSKQPNWEFLLYRGIGWLSVWSLSSLWQKCASCIYELFFYYIRAGIISLCAYAIYIKWLHQKLSPINCRPADILLSKDPSLECEVRAGNHEEGGNSFKTFRGGDQKYFGQVLQGFCLCWEGGGGQMSSHISCGYLSPSPHPIIN